MSDLPSMIAAIAFAVLVLFLALPLYKLGRLFDQLRHSTKEIGTSTNETVKEATATLRDAHQQIENIDTTTAAAARVAEDVSAVSTLVSTTIARPLIRLAAFSLTTRQAYAARTKAKTAATPSEPVGFTQRYRDNRDTLEASVLAPGDTRPPIA